ncbi:acetyltransferase [Candidatus Babeliales bacterium]|nr:acetyltransferase [Candidatus Babeliales bacterium]
MVEDKGLIVVVDPDPENKAAIRCYEKIGFKKIGEFQAPWGPALVMVYKKII